MGQAIEEAMRIAQAFYSIAAFLQQEESLGREVGVMIRSKTTSRGVHGMVEICDINPPDEKGERVINVRVTINGMSTPDALYGFDLLMENFYEPAQGMGPRESDQGRT